MKLTTVANGIFIKENWTHLQAVRDWAEGM